jgi:membrane-associated phospholipid phosphatase
MGEPEPEARPTVTQALEKLRSLETGVVRFKGAPTLPLPPVLAPPPAPEPSAQVASPPPPALEPPVQVAISALSPAVVQEPPLPSLVPVEKKEPAVAAPVPQLGTRAVRLKRAALGMLFLLFFVNYAETGIESWLRTHYRLGVDLEQVLGEAAQWFERGLSFEPYDATRTGAMFAVWGFSTVYYFFFPLLVLTTVFLFYRRRDPRPLLFLATAATIDYLLTLPFYIFFPVPERWTYPDSGAVLLSDLWTSKLIQVFRPFSGLNNCFPSFHVSMTVVLLACLYQGGTGWFRKALLPLGPMIVLSTFALGIHWFSDILAGLACGLVSFRLAEWLLPRMIASFQAFGVPRVR